LRDIAVIENLTPKNLNTDDTDGAIATRCFPGYVWLGVISVNPRDKAFLISIHPR
jgi:hypothetical protein